MGERHMEVMKRGGPMWGLVHKDSPPPSPPMTSMVARGRVC